MEEDFINSKSVFDTTNKPTDCNTKEEKDGDGFRWIFQKRVNEIDWWSGIPPKD